MTARPQGLSVRALTKAAFAPFGDVIENADSIGVTAINQGTAQRSDGVAIVDVDNGRPAIGVVRARARRWPLLVRMLERHPHGSQAFVPLDRHPFVVIAAPAGLVVEPRQIEAFLAREGQGVNYHKGVWHHPLLAIRDQSVFLVVEREATLENCEEFQLPESEFLLIESPETTQES